MTKRTTVPAVQTSPAGAGLDAITAPTPTVLVQVPLAQITPHPDNPRRDLGDLTELTDSIREHGVRQNLLLVPHPADPDRYRTVIGHRRAAAAFEAGLTEVPAVIDPTLTPAQQLELMLLENLQRSDLTPVEEAAGYQGLLDLGQTIAQVAAGTGRSPATVKARVRLLSLPERARERLHSGQGTLDDAAALADAEPLIGPHEVAWLADRLGAAGFRADLADAVRVARRAAAIAPFLERIVALGMTQVSEWPGQSRWHFAGQVDPSSLAGLQAKTYGLSAEELNALLDEEDATWTWQFQHPRDSDLVLYRPVPQTAEAAEGDVDPEVAAAREAEAAARLERQRQAEERRARCARFGELRLAWVTDRVRGKLLSTSTTALAGYAARLFGSEDANYADPELLDPLIGFDEATVKHDEDDLDSWKLVNLSRAAALAAMPAPNALLAVLVATVESTPAIRTDIGGRDLDSWYELLAFLGYQLSAEEAAHVLLPVPAEPSAES